MSLDIAGSFARVEKIARATKSRRMLYAPWKYLYAIFYRKILSHFFGSSTRIKVDTFFHRPMWVRFPAATDIYLAGGKTDDAELRLTRFFLSELKPDDRFVDIGAHFGYYALLASVCTGSNVIAIEPSRESFELLQKNTQDDKNITSLNLAVSAAEGIGEFYEFPHIFSEYSSVYPEQFQNQKWFSRIESKKTEVELITLDQLLSQPYNGRTVLKIDVEGSELDVLRGAADFLKTNESVLVTMEYADESRGNMHHQKAAALLAENGYTCFRIDKTGLLIKCEDVDVYLQENRMESDNLVFATERTMDSQSFKICESAANVLNLDARD